MIEAGDVIIVSDLHLAPEQGTGLFHADDQLSAFFGWVFDEACNSTLILAGDILDFLVADRNEPAGLPLDPAAAPARAASILEYHPEVFDALTRLTNSPNHQVFMVGGNHDPEVVFPEVQQEIASRLKRSYSQPPIRWVVGGEAVRLRVGAATVLIEHGDQYDDWNYIDHESLRKVVSLDTRGADVRGIYRPPPGSALVTNQFNLVRARFPWIERLQPLNINVLSLIIEVIMPQLERAEQSALWGAVREFERMVRRATMNEALRRYKPMTEYWTDGDEDKQRFNDWQAEIESDRDWGSAEHDFSRMIKRLRKVSAHDGFFDLERPDRSFRAVSRLSGFGNDLVVHGHTHAAKAYLAGQGLYLNSGTWGQLMRLPASDASQNDWIEFLKSLVEGKADSFSRPTFVRVTAQRGGTRAALCEWTEDAPEIEMAWTFEQDEREWRKEG